MSDKMRGALFNILGDIDGLTVLDAFGGSGALSFEALSRGAKHATIIENDASATRTIEQNSRELGLKNNLKLVHASANNWLLTTTGAKFDIVICDPPYGDLQINTLRNLAARITRPGIFVLSYPGHEEPPSFPELVSIKQQQYGDAQLIFYRHS